MDVVERSRCAPHITTDQVPSVDQQTSPPLKEAHASGLPSAAHVLERLEPVKMLPEDQSSFLLLTCL